MPARSGPATPILAALATVALTVGPALGVRAGEPAPTAEPAAEPAAAPARTSRPDVPAPASNKSRRWQRNTRVGPPGPDGLKTPRGAGPSVHRVPTDGVQSPLTGWAAAADDPARADRHRRPVPAAPQAPWGRALRVGEAFKFDLHFAGNPAGAVEAQVEARSPDPRGDPPAGAPTLTLRAKAVSAGVFGMLATVTDEMSSVIDAETGASISNHNHVLRGGLMAPYRDRHSQTDYEGRGYVRITDQKDDKPAKSHNTQVPEDTLDPLALMAWARFLDLEEGERAVAHTLDVRTLLRVEVVSRGRRRPDQLPSLVAALEISPDDITMLEGTLLRVDRHDDPIPDKRPFTFRAYISADGRGIPLVVETDIWVGVFRLSLAGYDPPREDRSPDARPEG